MSRFLIASIFLLVVSLACSLSPVVPPTAQPKPTAQKILAAQPPVETAQVTAIEALHIRTAPMATVIGYLYHGDVIYLSGKCQAGWAQIEWEGAVAWVNASYLSDNKCQTNKE